MLTFRRPMGSSGEKMFINKYIMPHNPVKLGLNLMVVVPGDPTTLFSCHTDTVHRDDRVQKVCYDANLQMAYKNDGEPLGADNAAGVFILTEMIAAGVPGTYLFHHGEERGCIGSRALAKEMPEFLRNFNRAIAFDRRSTRSVITFQMGARRCSDVFAQALCDALSENHKPDPTGLVTDTAHYSSMIPECTNVSCGYEMEHGPNECLDVTYLIWLRDKVLEIEWAKLPTMREIEKEVEFKKEDGEGEFTDDDLLQMAWEEIGDYDDAYDLVASEPALAAQMLECLARNSEWSPSRRNREIVVYDDPNDFLGEVRPMNPKPHVRTKAKKKKAEKKPKRLPPLGMDQLAHQPRAIRNRPLPEVLKDYAPDIPALFKDIKDLPSTKELTATAFVDQDGNEYC